MPESFREIKLDQQRDLFTRIAPQYDLINHVMTGWQDVRWRKAAVEQLQLPPSSLLLDIGSGNGQIIQEAVRQYPDCQCIAADLTQAMMIIGQEKTLDLNACWSTADTAYLPFPESTFDGVISGFLVRNLEDLYQGLMDQYRVLKPGGRIVVLDTSKPPTSLLAPLIRLYMTKVIPAIGGFLTGYKEAYTYLNDSTVGFLRAEELVVYLAAVGFKKVAYQQFTFGMITVLWGEK
jgi:demethylmenaquinone methyltransferase/2-methoxy-6-polyprenyl-1,4-benzoquinol methylase